MRNYEVLKEKENRMYCEGLNDSTVAIKEWSSLKFILMEGDREKLSW